jgi:taurine dioxygenase
MRTTPLNAPLGARLHLETDLPLDEAERAALRGHFAEHGLLLIREGPLDDAQQIELLSALGRIEPDDAGRPMRMEVTNQHDHSTAPEGELVFHYDYAYDVAPIPGISLYGEKIVEGVTPTCFVSSAQVIERLPLSLVERLRDLEAAHACFLHRLDDPHQRSVEPEHRIARGRPGWGPEHYWARHPAILRNEWGTETLFLCLQHTDRLVGMSRQRSDAMLEELFRELYRPEAVYEHAWQPHDLLIWDNLTVQHARPAPNTRPRTLRRYHLAETNLTADYLRIAREQGLV